MKPHTDVPSFPIRLSQAESIFTKCVRPHLQNTYPGVWMSTKGTPIDYQYGIDYITTHLHCIRTLSVRVWQSYPQKHFAIRYKRTGDVTLALEMESRLDAYHNDGVMSDDTIEAFVYRGKVYIAIIDTHTLWSEIANSHQELSSFYVTNPSDQTIFKRVEFDRFPPGKIRKIIGLL